MTNLSIDSKSLKTAARHLGRLIQERTGQSIPHSSILNTLVSGLDLGRNHGEMMARLAPTPAPVKRPDSVVLILAPDGTQNRTLPAALAEQGWTITRQDTDFYLHILELTKKEGGEIATNQIAGEGWDELLTPDPRAPGKIVFCAATVAPDAPAYSVDFLYLNERQLATASVCAPLWDAAIAAGINEDDALFAMAYDIEMANESIEVLAVMPSRM